MNISEYMPWFEHSTAVLNLAKAMSVKIWTDGETYNIPAYFIGDECVGYGDTLDIKYNPRKEE